MDCCDDIRLHLIEVYGVEAAPYIEEMLGMSDHDRYDLLNSLDAGQITATSHRILHEWIEDSRNDCEECGLNESVCEC